MGRERHKPVGRQTGKLRLAERGMRAWGEVWVGCGWGATGSRLACLLVCQAVCLGEAAAEGESTAAVPSTANAAGSDALACAELGQLLQLGQPLAAWEAEPALLCDCEVGTDGCLCPRL